MKKILPCEIVQDLFPSYIDGLTSDVTNNLIEEHIDECDSCKNTLKAMREPVGKSVDIIEKKEIDFLRKTRKKANTMMIGTVLAAVLLITVALTIKIYFIGDYILGDFVACEVQVNGKNLTLNGVTVDDNLAISSIKYEEQDSVVIISFRAVKESRFHKGEFQSEYEAKREITRVCLDNCIIWERGESVSSIASAIFQTRHDYIGDASKNGQTAKVLNMANYLGDFKSELQTNIKPYGWKIILEDQMTALKQKKKERAMKSYAYILLAVIDNLGEVSYEYQMDGKKYTVTVTRDDASNFVGQDIKLYGQDILLLQDLIQKIGLYSYI